MRKTDQNRIAKACGATIVSRPDEIQPSDVGTGCGLFKVSVLLVVGCFDLSVQRDIEMLGKRLMSDTIRFQLLSLIS